MPDWKKIKAEYVRGVSYRRLSEKYGVSFSSIQKRGASEKWTDLRKKAGRKADEKLVESIASQEHKRVEMFNSITEKLLQRISDGLDDGTIVLSPKGYNDLTAALKNLNSLKSRMDEAEQQARIDKLRKEAAIEEQNNEIKVVISSDLEEYSK